MTHRTDRFAPFVYACVAAMALSLTVAVGAGVADLAQPAAISEAPAFAAAPERVGFVESEVTAVVPVLEASASAAWDLSSSVPSLNLPTVQLPRVTF